MPGVHRLVTTALAVLVLVAWGAGAAVAATPRPAIDAITASPNLLPARGGSVVLRARVTHAVRCSFRGQHVAFASVTLRRTVSCSSGHATVRLPIAPNRFDRAVTLHFSLTASDRRAHTDYETITVVQAAKPAPVKPVPVAPVSIDTSGLPGASLGLTYSVALQASGGTEPYAWSVLSGTLPAGLALSNDGVLAGTPTAPGQYSFVLQVADPQGRKATHAYAITVTDTTVPAAPDAPTENSENWSGYGVAGGPFTSARGTFNVPAITGAGRDASAAEWVGIDGFGPGASSIIQAGVGEDYSAASNTTRIYAWYELYPAPAFGIPIPVAAGDTVTVSIAQESGGLWDLLVKDETNGQSMDNEFSYTGQATTAEWIVEAPFSTVTQSVVPLATFTPVTFSHLGAAPSGAPATRFVMFQDGTQISTPSPLSSNGFTVGYGGVTPGAP
jgi:hypothetical protein